MEQKMQQQDEQLLAHLQIHLTDWHLARQKFLVLFILALAKAQTVCFTRIAPHLSGVQISSNHRRIQRFFAEFDLDFSVIARIIWVLLPEKPTYRLSLDRTNWQFGGVDFNILMLSIITSNGLSIPILWQTLPKFGNSNQQERIDLMIEFVRLFGKESIQHLVADREFIGQKWFGYLIDNNIKFFIRTRENTWCYQRGKGYIKASWLFNNLPLNTLKQYHLPFLIKNQWVYISGIKRLGQKGQFEFVILLSYAFDAQTFQNYAQRWQIECLFKALKSSGFNIENTHLKDAQRLDKLLALVAITFVWILKIGLWQNQQKPIPVKSHKRLAQSVFRYGLDALCHALEFDSKTLKIFINLLSCT